MKHFISAVLFLSFFSLNAQIRFEKGYFITNLAEKTECFILNKDWRNNPTSFEYKLHLEDQHSKTADISSVTEFAINNESKYRRFEVNIERSSDNLADIASQKNPVYQKQTLFLKVLVEGDATLYQYNETYLSKYFYQTKTAPVTQLICIKYILNDNKPENSGVIRTNNQFRQQLLNDVRCESMNQNDFNTIECNEDKLADHFIKYNSCQGKTLSDFVVKKGKAVFNFKITAGASNTSLTISDPNFNDNKSVNIKGEPLISFGVEAESVLGFNKNKWSVFFNPSYQRYNAEKTYSHTEGTGSLTQIITHTVKVSYNYFDLPFGIRHYMFLNPNSKLFLNGAFSMNFNSASEIAFEDGEKIKIKTASNLAVGFGYSYKNRYSAELRTNLSREMIRDYASWEATYSTIGIILGYKVF